MEEELAVETILNNLKSQMLYKDECVRCFTENTDENGIYICLKTFEGFCQNHLEEYIEKSGNDTFLNYQVTVEKIEKEEKPQKITKLAIGVEGGIDMNNEKRTVTTRLYKKGDENYTLDGIDKLAKFVEEYDSAYKKTEVAAWEQDIKECEHVRNLVCLIEEKLTKEQLSKCACCDLTENLWLNLTTGHVGCGRKFYDGSGGNNHALEHYESTGYPVCVKSGTISPDGSASVFCYKCDDDVKVPNLPELLERMGLDVCTMTKTEKTMVEMNLELNLTFTLSKAYEKGRELQLVSGPGKTGLDNIGNSCYLNSVVQCLLNIPEIRQRYFEEGQNFLHRTKRQASQCFMSQMSKLAHGLCSGEYGQIRSEEIEVPATGEKTTNLHQDGIKPYMFRYLVGKGHQEFSTNKQQDAMEYLIHLLSVMGKYEKNFKLTPTSELFEFTQETRISDVTTPGKVKMNELNSKFLSLPLPVHKDFDQWTQKTDVEEMKYTATIQECLELFTKQTEIVGSTQHKRTGIKNFPKYLVIQTQNFVLNGWVPMKLHCSLQFGDYSNFSLEGLKLGDLPEGVEVVEDEEDSNEIQVDEGALAQLMSMGFGVNRCKRALIECGNSVENALNYIFSTMDDASMDEPITKTKKTATKASAGNKLFEQVWPNAQMMGLQKDVVEMACEIKTNPDEVIGYCFENMAELQKMIEDKRNSGGEFNETLTVEPLGEGKGCNYEIIGAVVHLGGSINVGHYIAYAKQGDQWIYFNDSKVAVSQDPDLGNAYVYILRRKD